MTGIHKLVAAACSLICIFSLMACAHGRPEVAGLVNNWFASDKVVIGDDHGTGVVIYESGYILTAGHVVKGAKNILFAIEDGQGQVTRLPAVVVAVDPSRDLAVLKVARRFEKPVVLAGPESFLPGDAVYKIGYPYVCNKLVVRGHIMGLRTNISIPAEKINVPNATIVNLLIGPGDSGGGLFLEKDGRLAGILIGIIELKSGSESPMPLRIAVSVDDIRSFLRKNSIPFHD
jgi:S1-C subfamily serine protease